MTRTQAAVPSGLPLADLVAFLEDPGAYPADTGTVEVIETHMAFVFLTGQHAYKLKKPVRYAYLDFRTPAARRRSCEAEVRLNRRLAPDVYLGVVALNRDNTGRLSLGGRGQPVDWLVRMRRLPSARFLDAAMAEGTVAERDLEATAEVLAAFYRSAPRQSLTLADYGGRLTATLDRAGIRLGRQPELAPRFHAVADALKDVIDGRPEFLAARVRDGRIVEGHGDLRPEHVCLTDPPVVIDCIEFEPAFRQVDPVDELAFLWMECEVAGQGWVGESLGLKVMHRLDDHPPLRLWECYKAVRAVLRAELALSHLEDVPGEDHDHWRDRAATYLAAAGRHAGLFLDAPLPD